MNKDNCFRCNYIRKCYERRLLLDLKTHRDYCAEWYILSSSQLTKCPCTNCLIRMRCNIESVFDYGHTFDIKGQPVGRECLKRIEFNQNYVELIYKLKKIKYRSKEEKVLEVFEENDYSEP